MIDPVNTDHGKPCDFCGEAATGADAVTVDGVVLILPTCDDCHHDQIVPCEQCPSVIRMADAVRIGRNELVCRPCAAHDATLTAEYIAAHKHDEQRDDFNITRR